MPNEVSVQAASSDTVFIVSSSTGEHMVRLPANAACQLQYIQTQTTATCSFYSPLAELSVTTTAMTTLGTGTYIYQAPGTSLYLTRFGSTSVWHSGLSIQPFGSALIPVHDFVPDAKVLLQRRRLEHKKRSSIKRSIRLLDNFGMEAEARLFISGSGDFYVSHPDSPFKFRFTRNRCRILDYTLEPSYSTPYTLELWTKDDKFVSRLCLLVKDTPILDQVLALAVFIRSGDEAYLLEKSNYFSKSKDLKLLRDVSAHIPKLAALGWAH